MRTDFIIKEVPSHAIIGYDEYKPIFIYRIFKDGKRLFTFEFKEPLKSKNQLKRLISRNYSLPLPF